MGGASSGPCSALSDTALYVLEEAWGSVSMETASFWFSNIYIVWFITL